MAVHEDKSASAEGKDECCACQTTKSKWIRPIVTIALSIVSLVILAIVHYLIRSG